MAHFAEIDSENKVLRVIVVSNNEIKNLPFPESELFGVAFCKQLFGENTQWAQTSYNASFRYNYAGIEFTFDTFAAPNGAFIPPQPFPSWSLDTQTYNWVPPVPYPIDSEMYYWNEASQSWTLV